MRLLSSKHLNKINVTKRFINDNLDMDLVQFIDNYYKNNSLHDIFIKIINNNFDQETIDFLKERLGNMNRFRDQRTAEEYACDLLLGWIVEDAITYLLDKLGYKSEVVSEDRKREFLKRPSAKIDICIDLSKGKEALIELVADNTGFWRKNKKIHLRERKYERLKSQNGVLLGLDFLNKEFFIEKIENVKVSKRIERHFLYGGKPATELSLKNLNFSPFDKMKKHLENFFEAF